jgi:hypothetical protein
MIRSRYSTIVGLLAILATSALQLTSTSSADAIPPPCQGREYANSSYALYGIPKWGPDAQTFIWRNDSNIPSPLLTRQFAITSKFGASLSAEARLGYTGEVDASGNIKVADVAIKVIQDMEVKFGISITRQAEVSESRVFGPSSIPAHTTLVIKTGSVMQTIQQKVDFRDEYCNVGTNYSYLNVGATMDYITDTGNGEFADPAKTRNDMGIGGLGLAEIAPPTCGSIARATVTTTLACMPSNPTVDRFRGNPPASARPGNATSGDVAGVVSTAGLVAAFRKGDDAGVWGVSQLSVGGSYGSWTKVGGLQTASYPVSLVATNGSIVVAARGIDNKIWGISQLAPGGAYGGWIQIGTGQPTFTGDPVITLAPAGQIVVYARATDGSVWGVSQLGAGGAYGAWIRLGAATNLASSPATVVASGLLVVAARGTDNKIWGISQLAPGGAYGGWIQIGTGQPTFTGDPSIMLAPGGQIIILAQGTDGGTWGVNQLTPGGAYGTWTRIGS